LDSHGGVASGDRIVARRRGYGEVEIDRAIADGTGESGRTRADIAGLKASERVAAVALRCKKHRKGDEWLRATLPALEDAIPSAAADLCAACGVKEIVTRAEETQSEVSTTAN
jgi:hypothetical protein